MDVITKHYGPKASNKVFLLAVTNSFCTGQNILADGGKSINYNFVWKNE